MRVDPVTVIVNVVGWLGMALLVGAYALVTTGRIPGTGLVFQLMNLLGGGLLMVNTAWYGAWPSAVLNLIWVVIGTVGLVRLALRRRGGLRPAGAPAGTPDAAGPS